MGCEDAVIVKDGVITRRNEIISFKKLKKEEYRMTLGFITAYDIDG